MNDANKINTRRIALEALIRIDKGAFSHVVLKETLDQYDKLDRNDRAFIKRLVTGTVSCQLQLDHILQKYVKNGLTKLKKTVLLILRMGLYQILYMDTVPDSAVCNEAVKLAEKKGIGFFKGFINGILRNLCRNKDILLDFSDITDRSEYLSVRYSMPVWLIRMWTEAYGEEKTRKMMEAFLADTETAVHINTAKTDPDRCRHMLEMEKIGFSAHPYCSEALILKNPGNISRLASFRQGYYQVQDISSMLVCTVAGIKEGDRILDVCAAPGGKSLHAAALTGEKGSVTSCDLTEKKTALIKENAKRLDLDNVSVKVQDACVLVPAYEEQFDLVIADVPCSGLGVIGRKSDIKYRITDADIKELVTLQRNILKNAVRYVRPGGTLLFSTCTVNRYENDGNLQWLTDHYALRPSDFSGLLCDALKEEPSAEKGYLQLMPGTHACDGFFLAKLIKEQ